MRTSHYFNILRKDGQATDQKEQTKKDKPKLILVVSTNREGRTNGLSDRT